MSEEQKIDKEIQALKDGKDPLGDKQKGQVLTAEEKKAQREAVKAKKLAEKEAAKAKKAAKLAADDDEEEPKPKKEKKPRTGPNAPPPAGELVKSHTETPSLKQGLAAALAG